MSVFQKLPNTPEELSALLSRTLSTEVNERLIELFEIKSTERGVALISRTNNAHQLEVKGARGTNVTFRVSGDYSLMEESIDFGRQGWEHKMQVAFIKCSRIVSGSDDRTLRVWTKSADGTWSSEEL